MRNKLIWLFTLVFILSLISGIHNIQAADIRTYAVIEDRKVTNLIRLDSTLVSSWGVRDPSITLIEYTGQKNLVIGSTYDSRQPVGSQFTLPVITAKEIRISELEDKIRSNTDTYREFREYIIFKLNIQR